LLQEVNTHEPELQDWLAWFRLQETPHPLQLLLVLMLVSQPLLALPSQSDQPLEQEGAHSPEAQPVVPWPLVHSVLQLPQLEVLVKMFTSHPLACWLSQLEYPVLQLTSRQTPPPQLSVALGMLHPWPQLLQLARVLMAVSQPLLALPSQLAHRPLQDGEQLPPEQVVEPWALEHP